MTETMDGLDQLESFPSIKAYIGGPRPALANERQISSSRVRSGSSDEGRWRESGAIYAARAAARSSSRAVGRRWTCRLSPSILRAMR
jgi:hypothetical protein